MKMLNIVELTCYKVMVGSHGTVVFSQTEMGYVTVTGLECTQLYLGS